MPRKAAVAKYPETPVKLPVAAPSLDTVVAKTESKANEITLHAQQLSKSVTTIEDERNIIAFRGVIKQGIEEASSIFDPIVKSAKQSYDEARRQRDKVLEPFEAADRTCLDAINQYRNCLRIQHEEQLRHAQQQQRELERQAVIDRENSRKLLEAEIERQLSELPADAPDELIAKIYAPLEDISGPVTIVPEVKVSPPPVAEGMMQQDNWKVDVTDPISVLRCIIADLLPVSLIEFKSGELRKLAGMYKDEGNRKYPGLKFYNEPYVRGTGR